MFTRHLALLSYLAGAGWASTTTLAEFYVALRPRRGRPSELSVRRQLHRDLKAFMRDGVPIEHEEGRWRLHSRSFTRWFKTLGEAWMR